MTATILVHYDRESQSWWAEADIDEHNALTTGAPTLDELMDRIPIVLRDLLRNDDGEGRRSCRA